MSDFASVDEFECCYALTYIYGKNTVQFPQYGKSVTQLQMKPDQTNVITILPNLNFNNASNSV